MRKMNLSARGAGFTLALTLICALACNSAGGQAPATAAKVLGTIQSISGKSLTVLPDSGAATAVTIEDSAKLLQIEPGKTDLKEAAPLLLENLQTGDRVLVRGILGEDGKTIRATSVIAIKKAAIAAKQTQERAEWQRGVGGVVKSIDPAAGTVVITSNGIGANREVSVHIAKDAVLRRYAPDSTRFDDAKPAPLSGIQVGDQLRARGTRGGDGTTFDAVEIVSGTFRNIAGTVVSTDPATNTLVVQDLASKAPVTLRITGESQMRKLPEQFAMGIAARLRGGASGGPGANQAQASAPPAAGAAPAPGSGTPGAPGGQGGPGAGRGDFQQAIARMPAASLADLKKGDAVMVVTTQGEAGGALTVITLLGGVEPILRASPKGGQDMILSPWSLGGGEPSGGN